MDNQLIKAIVAVQRIWIRLSETDDTGAETTETAIIVGVVAAAAVALTGLILAAISKYSAKIP